MSPGPEAGATGPGVPAALSPRPPPFDEGFEAVVVVGQGLGETRLPCRRHSSGLSASNTSTSIC